MTALNRKLIRDLFGMKGQAFAISMVIACGVATFVMALSTLEALRRTQAMYYQRYRFAHVFAGLKRAPDTLAQRIAEIPGVAQVQTRVVVEVNLDVQDMAEPAVGRLVSIPEYGRPKLNGVFLRRGRWIEPGRRGEVLAGESFAEAHGFEPGDSFSAVINGRREELTIVGVALSPEYIFQIRGADALPDDKRFGVFWMSYEQLAPAFDMDGAFNDVTLSLMRGASEPDVIARLDRLIEPYGGVGAYGRADQLSARFLSEEIRGLRGMGIIAPAIFLSVAAFLLNVVLSRLISTQREEIAALKAFGYQRWQIGVHYLKLVLLITGAGFVFGTAGGARLGLGMTRMYAQFYRFPTYDFRFDLDVALLAALVSTAAAVIGTIASVRRAMKLPPAEAMRPEPPAQFRPTVVERMGMQRMFSQAARMILRQLERKPLKALLSCFGISLAVAVLVLGNFQLDAIAFLITHQFSLSQRQDVSITYVEPASSRVAGELNHLPGVVAAESFRSVPVRLHFGNRSRRTGILGLHEQRRLFRLLDAGARPVAIPATGLLLSDKLAELLGARVGDTVRVDVLEGERPVRDLRINALIEDFSGTNAYMNIASLRRLMEEGRTSSGAHLSVDAMYLNSLYTQLKHTPRVAGVSVKRASLESFERTIAENQTRMQSFIVAFACIIAFGVVYNTARISLAERSRELATLRVIGFTRAEISAILLGELAVLTLAAVPLGCAIGYGFAALTVYAFETELFRIPLVVSRSTFGFAALVTLIASAASGLLVRRRLDRLDLVAVLKTKE